MPQSTEGMLKAKIVQLKNSCNEKVSIILVKHVRLIQVVKNDSKCNHHTKHIRPDFFIS